MTMAIDRPQAVAARVHEPQQTAQPSRRYAGFVTRTIAFAIDAAIIDLIAAIVGGVVALVLSLFPITTDTEHVLTAIAGVAFVLWAMAYFITFWTMTGQTPGNRVMRIRVLRVDSKLMRPRHGLIRVLAMVASLPLFWGYVPILLNDRCRGFPDAMARTIVVTVPDQGEA